MPGKMQWAVYVTDTGREYVKLADVDEVADANRGWRPFNDDPIGMPTMPRGSKPRLVYGISPTTGRRGHTIVAQITAPLWDPTGSVQTFQVSAEEQPSGKDTLRVTSRVGERFAAPFPAP